MGEIIAIRAQKRRSPVAPSGGAEILFFTGVRYQRAIEEEPSSAAEPRRRSRTAASAAAGVDEGAEPQ